MRYAIALLLLLPTLASAQNSVTLDLDLSNLLAPELTWSATPVADCNAMGDWSGNKGTAGNEILSPIRTSVVYGLVCDFPGESIATLTWMNPTDNEDGTPYDHSTGVTRLIWTPDGNLASFDCLDPTTLPTNLQTTDRPGDQTTHTVTGLSPADWTFGAFAVNPVGLCSDMSNAAAKTIQGSSQLSESISITVPDPITGLGSN